MSKTTKKHWYLLAFLTQQPGVWVPHSVIVASDENFLTVPQINGLKRAHNVPEASVMIGVSYLGFMSEKKINGQPDIDPPVVLSDAYKLGMVAAARIMASEECQPVNPYGQDLTDEGKAQAIDWQNGFVAVRLAQADNTTPIPQITPMKVSSPALPEGEVVDPTTKPSQLRNQPRK